MARRRVWVSPFHQWNTSAATLVGSRSAPAFQQGAVETAHLDLRAALVGQRATSADGQHQEQVVQRVLGGRVDEQRLS